MGTARRRCYLGPLRPGFAEHFVAPGYFRTPLASSQGASRGGRTDSGACLPAHMDAGGCSCLSSPWRTIARVFQVPPSRRSQSSSQGSSTRGTRRWDFCTSSRTSHVLLSRTFGPLLLLQVSSREYTVSAPDSDVFMNDQRGIRCSRHC